MMAHRTNRVWKNLAGIVVLGMLLVACGEDAIPGAEETQDDTEEVAGDQEGTDEEELSFVFSTWQWDEAGVGDYWREAVAEYEDRYPGRTIEVLTQPSTAYWDQLLIEIQGPDKPDLIHVAGFNIHEIAAMDALRPLDDLIDGTDLRERIQEGALQYTTIDGETMGYPVSGRTLELIYNERLLQEAGFDRPPETPDEFLEYARELTIEDGGSVEQYGAGMPNLDDRYTYESILYWTIAHGGTLARDGSPTLTDPATVAGVEFMQTLYDEELVPQGMEYPDQRQLLAQGNLAMLIDGSWLFPFIEDANPDILDDIRTATVPWESNISTGGTMHVLTVSDDTPYAEEIWDFIMLVSEPEWQVKYFRMAETLPMGVDVLSDEVLAEKPYFEAYVEGIIDTAQIPPEGMEDQYSAFSGDVQGVVTGDILRGGVSAEEGLATVQERWE